ncbi:c-type cytochrome [Cellulophaga baltica]|uniref:c-type cytochrome n=1 Tax=Cellulophaga TaxID=104264 RepID=UPI001C07A4F1|nr:MULTISPECIES: c-type cytochrome [Cellulophaga]MBU2996259.1 c-type cytochrome [Cellulophaga baltica]MDO6767654.1 c-type cytochrome [Cellulophaga sp. 1_MG-2023]
MKNPLFLLLSVFLLNSCSSDSESITSEIIETPNDEVWEVISIPESIQRTGDIEIGKDYLFSGNFMSSGIPFAVYNAIYGENSENPLERTGVNATIAYNYTSITAANGAQIVAPNCLNCHAAKINDELIVGLGNHSVDFTTNRADLEPVLTAGIIQFYGLDSPEYEAYEQFKNSIVAIGPKTITESIGVNTANKITEVLISHRDKNTLAWNDTPYITVDEEVIPADVPAWWLLKKKNAMFHTALNRNDFCKSFIGASLLTLNDITKAVEVDAKMPDVLAYIESIEAPEYPYAIDEDLATTGKELFNNTCSNCHGNYDSDDSFYPNSLVSLGTVNTDSELSNHYTETSLLNTYFFDWFNTGYFGTGENGLLLNAEGGYVAPPLDGVWATAPYFHNASVPTIMDVLNSENRPELWSRTFDDSDYDSTKLGWNYTVETSKQNTQTYDTSLKGYGNGGHTFGDELTDSERLAVLEYLKTL